MRIMFTNYKKIYIILGVFVFLITSLYIASVIVSRKSNKIDTINQVSKLSAENESTTKKFLLDKTKLIVNSLSSSSDDFRKDPVFQDIKGDYLNIISPDIQLLRTSGHVEYGVVDLSGSIYVRITDNSGQRSDLFEFFYQKNNKDEWKLNELKLLKQ